jgi:hypothetical protein
MVGDLRIPEKRMWSNESVTEGDGVPTEEKLCRVTALYVSTLLAAGRDADSIRRRVLDIAGPVIRELAGDEYRVESHFAIVQRSIDAVLARSSAISQHPPEMGPSSRDPGRKTASIVPATILKSRARMVRQESERLRRESKEILRKTRDLIERSRTNRAECGAIRRAISGAT